MSGPTIHQRLHGHLINWKDGPGWARDGSEIAKLRNVDGKGNGVRVLKVQLQDSGPIPVEQVAEWNAAGMKVWGMVGHVDGRDPLELAAWLRSERVRLTSVEKRATLSGLDLNFEDDVLKMDLATNGQWSQTFCTEARRLMPTLPMHLDSYWGPMGAGINLGAYKGIGCRFSVQTAWSRSSPSGGTWDDPPTNIVKKGLGAQPVIPKAIIKPILLTAPPMPDFDVAIADWKASGCKGGALYPMESYPGFEGLRDLIRRIIAAGCSY